MAIMTIPSPLHNDVNENGPEFSTVILNDKNSFETQSFFCCYAKVDEENGVTTIDIGDVPCCYKNNVFYVNSKEPIETWIGCNVYDYETRNGFTTYAIKPISNVMKFDNV